MPDENTAGPPSGTAREGAGAQEEARAREAGPEGSGAREGGMAPGGTAGTAGREAGREDLAGDGDGDTGPAGREGPQAQAQAQAPEGVAVRTDTSGQGAATRIGATGAGGRLISHDEGDKWTLRLQHAIAAFVDAPRDSVEEADQVLQEVTQRFTDAVTQRRRTLRTSWQTTGEDKADTEQLRLVLRDYRELSERLLRL